MSVTPIMPTNKGAELHAAQELVSSVLGAMSDLLIICDVHGRIQHVNPAMERFTNIPAASFVGKPLSAILMPPKKDAQEKLVRHLKTGIAFADCQVGVIDAKGNPLPVSLNCSPRQDENGHAAGMILIGRPKSELQQAYSELDDALGNFEQAQQHLVASEKMAALGRLVAGVAHELNNPISFVFGNMHAMKIYGEKITAFLQGLDNSPSPEALQILRQELGMDRIAADILPLVEGTLEGAERVSDIVQDLRRFSGNQTEPLECFSLDPVMRTALNWVLRGTRKQPETEIACPEDLELTSNKGHLHQILVNLVQNAVDALAATPDAKVTLTARASDTGVELSVSDNGPGISKVNLGQIFEPFFTTKPIGKGTGLGLYVSYRLADELGGHLIAKPQKSGACFAFSIPFTPPGSMR